MRPRRTSTVASSIPSVPPMALALTLAGPSNDVSVGARACDACFLVTCATTADSSWRPV